LDDQIEKNEIGRVCSTYGETKTHTGFWWGKLGKTFTGNLRSRWEDNIKMHVQEVGWVGMYWIDLAQNRESWRFLMECGNKVLGSEKRGKFLD
jgi:hypothetical protein